MYKTLTPAYGRDYRSKKAVMADWNADKDFQMQPEGCYVNKQQADQLRADGVRALNVRYGKLRKVMVIKL